MMPPKKESVTLADDALEAANHNGTLSPVGEKVKAEAVAHFARWVDTGADYYLRLARAKFASLRKGAK